MNRQPYNRSGFNRTAEASQSASGIALMKMGATASANRDIKMLTTQAVLTLVGATDATNVKRNSGKIAMVMASNGNAALALDVGSGLSQLVMAAFADFIVQGEAVINLPGLVLAPGDELVINTIDMIVTINSQNGMRYFSMDSDFFSLLNGANTIVYGDLAGSRNVSVDVIWKDRWL